MTPAKHPKRPAGLDNLLDYVARHIPPCCVAGDDDPDPTVHDPSCWFPGQVEWSERMEAARADKTAERARQAYLDTQRSERVVRSEATRRTTSVTPHQERTLWHIHRHGVVTQLTPAPNDGGRRIGWPSVNNLALKGLVIAERGEPLSVLGMNGEEYKSPTVFTARLTDAGREWIAERMTKGSSDRV